MSDVVPAFVTEFNAVMEGCATFRYITRDSALQRDSCATLRNLLAKIKAEKEAAKASNDENYTNVLLGCECAANALIFEIDMWVLLKESRPDEAWDALVDAEYSLLSAMRAHEGFAHLKGNLDRLHAIERLIFPPQVFLSSGMIVSSQICSICGAEYEDCEHVKGRPYMGQLCGVTLIPSAIDHVSIVDNPANKKCRITKFSVEGGNRNRMTWLVEPSDNKENEEHEESTVEGIFAVSTPSKEKTAKEIKIVE
jgi:hypothetical protein